jgi:hypothetical protein
VNAIARTDQRQRPGDIVIHRDGAGAYVISQIGGERLGTCDDRFGAMRRACAIARETGANVWICAAGTSQTYHDKPEFVPAARADSVMADDELIIGVPDVVAAQTRRRTWYSPAQSRSFADS